MSHIQHRIRKAKQTWTIINICLDKQSPSKKCSVRYINMVSVIIITLKKHWCCTWCMLLKYCCLAAHTIKHMRRHSHGEARRKNKSSQVSHLRDSLTVGHCLLINTSPVSPTVILDKCCNTNAALTCKALCFSSHLHHNHSALGHTWGSDATSMPWTNKNTHPTEFQQISGDYRMPPSGITIAQVKLRPWLFRSPNAATREPRLSD